MRKHQYTLFNASEIIVDNFAGGGGASTGIELAVGHSVDVAINHDPAAIAMHRANHPDTEHYCESVWDVDPRQAAKGRPVALCWLSPDCKHFSKAKGGKPVDKSIRGLAWLAVRWAATVKPRVIILENVEEFVTWGPLTKENYPDPKQKGRTFKSFVNALKRHGYEVNWKELKACDFGAPTVRKRLFLIARRDGKPIQWPAPTHGDPKCEAVKVGKIKPWRNASEIIDWALDTPSIFERTKPLVENTMRRIVRGIFKFVLETDKPFIAPVVKTKVNDHCDLVAAFLTQYHTETANHEVRGQALSHPILTLDTSNRYSLVAAFLAKHYGGNYTGAGSGMDAPVSTITTTDHNALVTSHLLVLRNNMFGQGVEDPLYTVTSGGTHFGEVRAFLTQYNGASIGQKLDQPLNTISTHDRFGLVTIHGQNYAIVDIGMRMLEPHELFAAQGFPDDYIIDRDADGKKYPKKAQVARCGNSVPPPFAEYLVRANLPEICEGVIAV